MPAYSVVVRKLTARLSDAPPWTQCIVLGKFGTAAHLEGPWCMEIRVSDGEDGTPETLCFGDQLSPHSAQKAQDEYERRLAGAYKLNTSWASSELHSASDAVSFIMQVIGVPAARSIGLTAAMLLPLDPVSAETVAQVDDVLRSLPDALVSSVL
jgi:hypothetical protein